MNIRRSGIAGLVLFGAAVLLGCGALDSTTTVEATWIDIEHHKAMSDPVIAEPASATEPLAITDLRCAVSAEGTPDVSFRVDNPSDAASLIVGVAAETESVGAIVGFAHVEAPSDTSRVRLGGEPPASAAFEIVDGRGGRLWAMSDTCTVMPVAAEDAVVFADPLVSSDIRNG
ncbi:MAG: hypothetical protein AAGD35_22915 [Actinomycetota bacterium]